MKKIFLVSLFLFTIMFLVSCAPQTALTDEELEAELAKLTPEERQQLMADLETKESGALAGQAIRLKPYAKKVSPKVFNIPKARLVNSVTKIETASSGSASEKPELKCFDQDGGDPYVVGNATKGLNYFEDKCLSKSSLSEAYCDQNNNLAYKRVNCKAKNENDYCEDDRCQFSSTEDKALYDCKKLENKEKDVHYCTEAGDLIFYDRYHCTYFEGKAVPTKDVGASYNKNSLYDEVDSCAKILAKFEGKPNDAVVGCFDSDMNSVVGDENYLKELSSSLKSSGYIEMVTIGGGMMNKVKEVDTCAGFDSKFKDMDYFFRDLVLGLGYNYEVVQNTCPVGYYQGGFPPSGYELLGNNECTITTRQKDMEVDRTYVLKGTGLFERKCPDLFESSIPSSSNTYLNSCSIQEYACDAGRCSTDFYVGKSDFKNVDSYIPKKWTSKS